jgi:dTDP-4-amino-4,6-dideoxygalactose transaminase
LSYEVKFQEEAFLPFSKPTISQEAIGDVVECLNSGWITSGPKVQKFEEALGAYLGAPYVLSLTSATAGLFLALKALDLRPGDEVITTSLTFVATLNTIVHAGGKPVLVDIDKTYNMDVKQIEQVISSRTRAIMPVHFTGLSVNLDPIYALTKKHHLHVIEDAAQAIGSGYKNKKIGSFGDMQVFSFHPNKNMTTIEGGCIALRDEELFKKLKHLRFHGIDRDAFNRFSKSGSQHYDVVEAGYKYNMPDVHAALGLHQLASLDSFIEKRKSLAKNYMDAFKGWSQITLPQLPSYDHDHSWHLFSVLIHPEESGVTRDQFIEEMKKFNIGTGLHYQPVHLFTYYQDMFGFYKGEFPVAERVTNRIVSLPLFPTMSTKDQERVIQAMAKIFKRG